MDVSRDRHKRDSLSPHARHLPPPQSIDTAFTKGIIILWGKNWECEKRNRQKLTTELNLAKFFRGENVPLYST